MIEAVELQKRFGPVRAVANVSFTAHNGSITGLLGANETGKTTTLRMIAGVLRQESGCVRVDGRSPEEGFPVRVQIGALLDHTGLYARLTVREHFTYFGELYGLSCKRIDERVHELLTVLGLNAVADRRAGALSQGQRMKVALGRAMIHSPQTVITAVAGSLGTVWAMASEQPAMRVLAIWVWASLLITWIFRFMNDKGNWSGAAPDTEAFLHLSLRRGRASLRAVKFGFVLYFAQLAIVSTCVYLELNRRSPIGVRAYLTLTRSLVVWFCAALFLLWMVWYARKKKAELNYLLEVQQDMETYTDELEAPTFQNKKRWKLTALLSSLVRAHISSLSQLEEFDWRVRRKKKVWKI